MRRMLEGGVLVLGLLGLQSANLAQAEPFLHPQAPPHGPPLPPGVLVSPFFLPPPAYHPSAYEHWQYRSVTNMGTFRPRAVYGPYGVDQGAYYLYNGHPVPAATLHNVELMPYARE